MQALRITKTDKQEPNLLTFLTERQNIGAYSIEVAILSAVVEEFDRSTYLKSFGMSKQKLNELHEDGLNS